VRHTIDSLDAQFGAAFSKGDMATVANIYAQDAITLPPNMKADRGRAAIQKSLTDMTGQMTVESLKLSSEDVIVTGDYAIETGKYEMTGTPKGGKSMHDEGKYLVVWKKQPDGSLKILRDAWNSDKEQPMAPAATGAKKS
jgi:uncharacterized protein (TIGR02246 family)